MCTLLAFSVSALVLRTIQVFRNRETDTCVANEFTKLAWKAKRQPQKSLKSQNNRGVLLVVPTVSSSESFLCYNHNRPSPDIKLFTTDYQIFITGRNHGETNQPPDQYSLALWHAPATERLGRSTSLSFPTACSQMQVLCITARCTHHHLLPSACSFTVNI